MSTYLFTFVYDIRNYNDNFEFLRQSYFQRNRNEFSFMAKTIELNSVQKFSIREEDYPLTFKNDSRESDEKAVPTNSGLIKDKTIIADTKTNNKKIVFIGDSAMPFGLRSDLIEEEIPDYKVVNFGLYGSIGTKFMVDLSKSNVIAAGVSPGAPFKSNVTLYVLAAHCA